MSRKFIITIVSIISFGFISSAQDFLFPSETYLFEKRDTCDLFLDIYNPAEGSQTHFEGREKPTILFMFGGGFIRGERNDES